ncbi:glycosyltransferase [candidate division KSB3 bacterium]|uniref:Glycosyltransferase n=1 Tax=candidate division KSB3 bacterium TaxID=2044937 RepID=A0A2G6E7H9_9BACT|nr:MAG: glycosyltransferase [candidate division KSB3 bacterium]PIE30379.1 MAG: glycosyltransferase [candidate division KSB3 bacterium]
MKNRVIEKGVISFVVPVYNEQDTVRTLFDKIAGVMTQEKIAAYEVVFIDDGSSDNSWQQIETLLDTFPEHVVGVRFRKNFGKAAALRAGFCQAQGGIVFTMDADLQDDPEEIPRFLDKLHEGFDLVSGWKAKRHDPLSKTLPSKLFNKATSLLTGIQLHDFNCGFKAYRRDVLECLDVYGELHRYIPVLADEYGFRIGEIPVRHRPRQYGVSKYGFERYSRGFLDLLTVIAVTRYMQRPAHLFGGVGILSGLFGSASLLYLIILWFLGYRPIGNRPLLLFGILAVILAVQLISLGVIAELSRREHHLPDVEKMIQHKLPFQKTE